MKALYVINNLGSGGAEKLIAELVPKMNSIESTIVDILLLTDKDSLFINSLNKSKVSIFVIKYRNLFDPRNILEERGMRT